MWGRVEIVYVEPSFPQLFAQNRARDTAVPEAALQHLIRKLEPPDATEAHRVVPVVPG